MGMAIYRGNITQSIPNTPKEVVIASGLCCAVPFQVLSVDFGIVEWNNVSNSSGTQTCRLSASSAEGNHGLGSKNCLAVKDWSFYSSDAVGVMVVLPFSSTSGDVVLRLETDGLGAAASVDYVINVEFKVLKELEYMRLKADGY
jgi:hypothetical protein